MAAELKDLVRAEVATEFTALKQAFDARFDLIHGQIGEVNGKLDMLLELRGEVAGLDKQVAVVKAVAEVRAEAEDTGEVIVVPKSDPVLAVIAAIERHPWVLLALAVIGVGGVVAICGGAGALGAFVDLIQTGVAEVSP